MRSVRALPGQRPSRDSSVLVWSAILGLACAVLAGDVKTWGGTGSTQPGCVALDGASNVYVVGGYGGKTDFDPGPATNSHTADGYRDAFLSKFSADGSLQWVRTWGGSNDDRANGVVVYGSNLYVSGCFQDTVDFKPGGGDPYTAPRGTNGYPNNDAFLCKYDTSGNYQWTRVWGGNGGDEAYGITVDSTGFVYVCGDFSTTNMSLATVGLAGSITNQGRWDAFILKFDEGGTCRWVRCWGGPAYDDCTCIAVDRAGNAYGGGMFASATADFDPGPGAFYLHANNPSSDWGLVDVFLTKLDAEGYFQWARAWGESNHWDAAQGVALDSATNVYVSGYFADTVDFNPLGVASNLTSRGLDDAFLCKYTPDGAFVWAQSWGGSTNDYARGLAVDGAGFVYVSGDFSSTNVDFDPGPGVNLHSSNGGKDIALSKFDLNGRLVLARTCGGIDDDAAFGGVAVDRSGNAYEVGAYAGTVDFGPLTGGGGTSNPPASVTPASFLAQIPTAWPLTVLKSGNGWSTLGSAPSATRFVSLGVTTQVVYTAADWHRIQSLSSNGVVVAAAAGGRAYTQMLANVAGGITSTVVYALASPGQTGYTNVPTEWLTNWAETAVIADPAFDVHSKYVLGLDPCTSNTFALCFDSINAEGSKALLVLRRLYTGGLSPDGMHGQLQLQAADDPVAPFTNLPATVVSGASVFDLTGRRTYTNAVDRVIRCFRATIQ